MPTSALRHPGQRDLRGKSQDLWGSCNIQEIRESPDWGWYLDEDFMGGDATMNNWTLTQASSGTEVSAFTDTGGTIDIDAGATTVTQGVNLQAKHAMFKPAANQDIYFECRVANSKVGGELFFGLAEVDTSIIATSAVSTANHIAYSSITDDGVLIGNGEKASAGTTTATLHTFVANTYVKLGFKVTGISKVEWFVDGVKKAVSTNLATANIPIVVVCPSIVVQADGTNQPVVTVDWVACYQQVLGISG